MTTTQTRISDLIVRVQDEFLKEDTPLTAGEIRQRVRIDDITCDALLGALVDAGVLVHLEDLYVRASGRARPGNGPTHSRRVAA